jgi:hypothetical protein
MHHYLVKGTDTEENKCKRIAGKEIIIQFMKAVNKEGANDPKNEEGQED